AQDLLCVQITEFTTVSELWDFDASFAAREHTKTEIIDGCHQRHSHASLSMVRHASMQFMSASLCGKLVRSVENAMPSCQANAILDVMSLVHSWKQRCK